MTDRFTVDASYNFDRSGLRGANIDVLPFLRIFPPPEHGGYPGTRGWTVHFGWLFWTVVVHQFPGRRASQEDTNNA